MTCSLCAISPIRFSYCITGKNLRPGQRTRFCPIRALSRRTLVFQSIRRRATTAGSGGGGHEVVLSREMPALCQKRTSCHRAQPRICALKFCRPKLCGAYPEVLETARDASKAAAEIASGCELCFDRLPRAVGSSWGAGSIGRAADAVGYQDLRVLSVWRADKYHAEVN